MTLLELNEHFDLLEKLDKAEEVMRALRDASHPQSPKLSGMPRTPGVKDKVGDLAVELADMNSRIRFLQAEISRQEAPIEAFISEIEDDQTRMAFRLRFLRGLSWKEVSSVLGRFTSERSVSELCYKYLRSRNGVES